MFATDFPPPSLPDALICSEQPTAGRPQKAARNEHADFLDLPGLESDSQIDEGQCLIRVKAKQVAVPTYPDCACPLKEVKAHTPFIMKRVLHVPRGRKSLVIDIVRRRWMCKNKSCRRTVTQPLAFMAEHRYRMTQQLLEYIEVQSLLGTELSLSEETGVFVRTIREIRERLRLRDRAREDRLRHLPPKAAEGRTPDRAGGRDAPLEAEGIGDHRTRRARRRRKERRRNDEGTTRRERLPATGLQADDTRICGSVGRGSRSQRLEVERRRSLQGKFRCQRRTWEDHCRA